MLIGFLKLIANTFFKSITLKGIENLPDSERVIFTPNHPNALLDPLLLLLLPLRHRICFVAKAPLFRIPLLGGLMRRIGVIPVVRRFEAKEGQVDHTVFFSTCVSTLAAGRSIVIFPEGISLPQPYMAPLKTGVARLYFMALKEKINVHIVPVGLNYEHGSTFRSSVVVWVAPPVTMEGLVEKHRINPQAAVRELTDRIGQVLDTHVFQTENFHDRELMLMLEQIYSKGKKDDTWGERLKRLKQFEMGLRILRSHRPAEIEHLRTLLTAYRKRLSVSQFSEDDSGIGAGCRPGRFLVAAFGFPLASLGWLLNVVPYQLCNLFVKHVNRFDASAAATYKVVYGLFLFPATNLVEALIVRHWAGGLTALAFAAGIVPASYYTLYFFEWLAEGGWGISALLPKLRKDMSLRAAIHFKNERRLIIQRVDMLADWLDRHSMDMG